MVKKNKSSMESDNLQGGLPDPDSQEEPANDVNGNTSQAPKNQVDYYRYLVNGARVATLVALALTIAGVFQSNSLVGISRELLEKASTQYIGNFPDNLDEITSLVARAEHDIFIVTDVAAYGHFSNHDQFKKYVRALREKADSDGFKVTVAVYDEKTWKSTIPSYFAKTPLQDLLRSPRTESYWNDVEYREENSTFKKGTISNHCQFLQRLWEDELFYRKWVPGVSREVPVELPIRAWVIDRKEAIFTLQAVDSEQADLDSAFFPPDDPACNDLVMNQVRRTAGEVSFLTRDGSLVAAVLDLIENYAAVNNPVEARF